MARSTTRIQKLTRVSTLNDEDVIALGPSDGDRAKGITFVNLVDSIPDNMTTVQGNSLVDHESLVCSNPTASTVDIDASAVSVRNDVNVVRRIENINLTIDITVSGENGLDIGSEAADTFYHFFVIFNPETSTTSGLFSLSPTGPTLPTGFTFFGLVGAIHNDSGNDFNDILQVGNLVTIDRVQILNSGSSTTIPPVSVDLSTTIPISAIKFVASLQINDDAANMNSQGILFAIADVNFQSAKIANIGNSTPLSNSIMSAAIQIHVPQTTFYRVLQVSQNLDIDVLGWEF